MKPVATRRGVRLNISWFGGREPHHVIRSIGPRCPHGRGIFFGRALSDCYLGRENFEKTETLRDLRELRAL